MSIKPTHPTSDSTFRTISESFTTSNAPRTFDPFNTRDCPGMFADKWEDNGDGQGTQR